jgi:serine/threonine-protein kinase HipA
VKLPRGAPLTVSLSFGTGSRQTVARVALAAGLAQLEWTAPAIAAGLPISPVYYPLEPGLHAARGRDFHGLHAFLADSLPDSWGRLLVHRRLANLKVNIDDLTVLEQLALVGDQGRGALIFEPATMPPAQVETLDLDLLAAESGKILQGEESHLVDELARVAGASGGARPKVLAGLDADGRVTSLGETAVAGSQDAWLVKFAAQVDAPDIGPIEEAYATMADAAGLTLSPHRLLPAKKGPGYFATRRFDRPAPGERLHMLSLCGAIEAPADRPSASYDTFLRATLHITRHADDVAAAFRRMVFNVLAHNRDDHTRQHSYLMDATGNWRLAPAYDLTYSAGPGGEHYLDVEGEGRNPTRAHVTALGRRHGLSDRTIATIVNDVRDATARWPHFARGAGVTKLSTKDIAAAHASAARAFAS